MIGGISTGIAYRPIGIQGPQPEKLRIPGRDNYGKPRQEFADKLALADDRELRNLTEEYIWLSAYAASNIRSDYHWMCDATYEECIRRDAAHIYETAWHRASGM